MTVELTGHGLTLDEVVRVARASERVELSAERARAHARASRRRRARVAGGHADVRRDDGRRDASRRRRRARATRGVQPLRDLRPPRRPRPAGRRRRRARVAPPSANALAAGLPGRATGGRRALHRRRSTTATLPRVQLARHGRAGRPRAERRPRARRARGPRARGGRGDRAARQQRVLDRTGRARGRRRARARSTGSTSAAALDFEAFRANVGALHPEVAVARPYSGTRRDAHADALAARRERALGARRSALPPGSADVPMRAAGARRRSRRAAVRREPARRRAERAPGESADRARRGTARLGRELRLAAARDRARPRAPRARAGAHGGGRANAEAPEPAIQRPDRGARRERGLVAGRALRARRRRAGDRGRGAAARPARLRRARLDHAGVGRRGSHALSARSAARRLAEMLDLGARVVAVELVVAAQAIDLRGDVDARQRSSDDPCIRARAHPVPRRRPSDAAAARRARIDDSLAARLPHDDDVRRPPAPLARGVRRCAAARDACRRCSTATSSTTREGRFAVDLAEHEPRRAPSRARPRRDRRRRALAPAEPRARGARRPTSGMRSRSAGSKERASSCRRRGGRFLAFSPSRVRDGFVGVSIGSSAFIGLRSQLATSLDAAAAAGTVVFVHPDAGRAASAARPDWWEWVIGYPARMQEAYVAWLAFGRERWPYAARALRHARRRRAVPARAARAARRRRPLRARPEHVLRRLDARAASDRALRRDVRRRTARRTAATRRSSTRRRRWMPSAVSAML